jgi:hypothetical protein
MLRLLLGKWVLINPDKEKNDYPIDRWFILEFGEPDGRSDPSEDLGYDVTDLRQFSGRIGCRA